MMKLMNFQVGKGVGKNEDGIQAPLEAFQSAGSNAGLGKAKPKKVQIKKEVEEKASAPVKLTQEQRDFQQMLKNLPNAALFSNKTAKDPTSQFAD